MGLLILCIDISLSPGLCNGSGMPPVKGSCFRSVWQLIFTDTASSWCCVFQSDWLSFLRSKGPELQMSLSLLSDPAFPFPYQGRHGQVGSVRGDTAEAAVYSSPEAGWAQLTQMSSHTVGTMQIKPEEGCTRIHVREIVDTDANSPGTGMLLPAQGRLLELSACAHLLPLLLLQP